MARQSLAFKYVPRTFRGPEDEIKILVLDDDQFDRMRIRRLIHQIDATVHVEEIDGIEALRPSLDANEFDVVIVDYRLPAGDGLEALKIIKSHPSHRHAATVMISGVREAERAFNTSTRACDQLVMKKHLDAQKLREAVLHALSLAQVRQGTRLGNADRFSFLDVAGSIENGDVVELKPVLARILRQIRFLRQVDGTKGFYGDASIIELETACRNFWTYLETDQANR